MTIDTDEENAELQKALQPPLSAGGGPSGPPSGRRSPSGSGGVVSSLAMTPTAQAAAQQRQQQQGSSPLPPPQVYPIGFGGPPKSTSPNLSARARETAGAKAAQSPPAQRK